MGYLPDATITALRKSVKLGYYFHLATSTPFRLWSGPADITQELPGVDPGPSLYKGTRLHGLPEFDAVLNAGAARLEFTLEGVSADSAEKIAGLDPDVNGKRLYVGFAVHDDAWQATSGIMPLGTGRSDFWAMERTVAQGGGIPTCKLSLSVAFGESGRKRPRRMAYSDAQQQFLFPGDTFCQDTPRYHRGYIVAWPRF